MKKLQESASLWLLLYYSLTFIVACLSVFNLYLFLWIWSSLDGSGSSFVRSSQSAKLDLIGSSDEMQFRGKLTSKETIEVGEVRSRLNSVKVLGGKSVKLRGENSNVLFELLSDEQQQQRVNFPSGLIVRGLSQASEPVLVCKGTNCKVSAKNVKFNSKLGVNFNGRSIQASRIETKRLHSPTNALQMLSLNGSLFEGSSLELNSLDALRMSSRYSNVIIDAQRIDFSRIKAFKLAPRNQQKQGAEATGYRLCICLIRNQRLTQQQKDFYIANGNLGSIFGIKPNLNCENFSASYCGRSSKSKVKLEEAGE